MPKQVDIFKQLRAIHTVMLVGTFSFTFTVFFGHRFVHNNKLNGNAEKIMVLVVLVLAASSLLFGLSFFKKRIAEIQNSKEPAKARMDQYKAACIVFWALLEGSAILSAVIILMTGNYFLVGVSALLLIVLGLFAPQKEKIIEQLNLETNEVADIESNVK